MALLNIDIDKAAKDAVDEAALKLAPVLDLTVDKLIAELKGLLVGRTITITIS